MIVAVGGLGFWVTTTDFFNRVVWPRVAAQTGLAVSASSAHLNPLGRLTFENLLIMGPTPEDDTVEVALVDVEFDLASVFQRAPLVRSVMISDGTATLTRRRDGTIALLADMPPREPSDQEPMPFTLAALDIADVAIHLTDLTQGTEEPLEGDLVIHSIRGADMDLERGIRDLDLRAEVAAHQGDHTDVTNGTIAGTVDLVPRSAGGLDVTANIEAEGFAGSWRGTPLAGVALTLATEAAIDRRGATRIQSAEVDLARGATAAGHLSVAGDYNPQRGEGQFTLSLSDLTDETFELVMARPGGVDFGDSRAAADVEITLADRGQSVTVQGRLDVDDLSVLATGIMAERTPPLDFTVDTALEMDLGDKTLTVSTLSALGDLAGRRLFEAALDRPVALAWGAGAAAAVPPARLTVSLDGLDLEQVRPLLPGALAAQVRSGRVNLSSHVDVSEGGQQVAVNGSLRASDLVLSPEGTPLPALDVDGEYALHADTAHRRITVNRSGVAIARAGGQAGAFDVEGAFDFERGEGTLQIHAEDFDLTLPGLLLADSNDLRLSAGTLSTDTTLTLADAGARVDIAGQSSWRDLGLTLPAISPDPLPLRRGEADLRASHGGEALDIESLTLRLGERGSVAVSGRVNASGDARLTLRSQGLDLATAVSVLGDAMPLRIDAGEVTGEGDLTLAANAVDFDFDGTVSLDRWGIPGAAETMTPLAAQGQATVALGGDDRITVEPLRADLSTAGQPSGRVAGELTIDLKTAAMTFEGDAEDVDVALVQPFFPADTPGMPRRGAATWRGAIAVTPRPAGVDLRFDGRGDLAGVELDGADDSFDADLTGGIALVVDTDTLRVETERFAAALQRGGRQVGDITLTGGMDLLALSADLQADIARLDLAVVRPLLPGAMAGQLRGGVLDFDGSLRSSSNLGTLTSAGRVTLTDLVVASSGGAMPPIGLDFDHSVELAGEQLNVQRAEGTITRAGQAAGGFNVSGDLALDTFAGTLEIELRRAALGGFLPLVTSAIDPAVVAGLVADGRQRVELDLSRSRVSASGQMTLDDALRITTPLGPRSVRLTLTDNLQSIGDTLRLTDTRVTAQIGERAPETVTLDAALDLSGADASTVSISGGSLDLSPYVQMFGGGGGASGGTHTQRADEPFTLPDVPDPGRLRLRGDVRFDSLKVGELVLLEPAVDLRWARFSPDQSARELSLPRIDVQIVGPRNTGRLTGNVLAMNEGGGEPLDCSVDLRLTASDFEALLPTLAPNLVDKITGGFSLERFQFSCRGNVFPRDLDNLRGGLAMTLLEGEIVSIPLLEALVRSTGLTVLERLQFFEGGLTMRANGDHLVIRREAPLWLHGDLTHVTAVGQVFYDNRQSLRILPAVHESFPHLGDLMGRVGDGYVFPRHPQYPEYRIFPLSLTSNGSWTRPRVRLGPPLVETVEAILPVLLEDLLGDLLD